MRTIVQGAACPKCAGPLSIDGSEDHARDVLGTIREGWQRTRIPVYGAVLVATFIAGWIPLLGTLVTAVAMVAANLWLIRRPLRWLPTGRRILTRLFVRLWLLFLVLWALLLNVVAIPLIAAMGIGAALTAAVGVATTFLYVEGALMLVEQGVKDAADPTRTGLVGPGTVIGAGVLATVASGAVFVWLAQGVLGWTL